MEREAAGGRGAVLLIGSLWWDDIEVRRRWREGRLDMGAAERVHAPIRYGRWSRDGRRCTMTLVRRGADGGGTGYVVPFRRAADLDAEAQALWDAERRAEGPGIGAPWGTVGAICRAEDWRRRWADVFVAKAVMPDGRERGEGRVQGSAEARHVDPDSPAVRPRAPCPEPQRAQPQRQPRSGVAARVTYRELPIGNYL